MESKIIKELLHKAILKDSMNPQHVKNLSFNSEYDKERYFLQKELEQKEGEQAMLHTM